MNKKDIDRLLPYAVDVLKLKEDPQKNIGIVESKGDNKGKINKKWRAQISSFGATVEMAHLLGACVIFSDKGGASVERQRLLVAINELIGIGWKGKGVEKKDTLFETVKNYGSETGRQRQMKEIVLTCAVVLKLAMNVFGFYDDNKKNAGGDKPAEPAGAGRQPQQNAES